MANKVVFATFADNKYLTSLKRIEFEAKQFSCIDEIHICHQEDIEVFFINKIKPWLYRRGFGYWRWKSYFAKRLLDELDNDDILIWVDAGCELNVDGSHILQEWIVELSRSTSCILVFEQSLLVKYYTKKDALEFLNVNEKEASQPQFLGGAWIIKKNLQSQKLIDDWYSICLNHEDLINDKKSSSPNYDGFVEHRHDQSIFSILARRTNPIIIKASNLTIEKYSPIITSRNKQKTTEIKILEYLFLPWRYILGCYLKCFRGFYFKDKIIW